MWDPQTHVFFLDDLVLPPFQLIIKLILIRLSRCSKSKRAYLD